MSEQNNKGAKSVNAFSPSYVSQITPFRPVPVRVPVLDHGKYNLYETIATPDEGKKARLLKANI